MPKTTVGLFESAGVVDDVVRDGTETADFMPPDPKLPPPDPDPERDPPRLPNPLPLPDPNSPGPDVIDPGIAPEPLPA